jgi:hypothetical protein
MVLLIALFDTAKYLYSLLDGGFFYQNGLEAPFQSSISFNVFSIVIQGGGTDAL